jgi:DNA-binding NtrC family response regulator
LVLRGHCLLQPLNEPAIDLLDGACKLPLREAVDQFTSAYLTRLLQRHGGDLSKVAEQAGYHVTHIRRLLRTLSPGPTQPEDTSAHDPLP